MLMFEQLQEYITDKLHEVDRDHIKEVIEESVEDWDGAKCDALIETMITHMQDALQTLEE